MIQSIRVWLLVAVLVFAVLGVVVDPAWLWFEILFVPLDERYDHGHVFD